MSGDQEVVKAWDDGNEKGENKKESLLGPISKKDVKEGTDIADLGEISTTHERPKDGAQTDMVIQKKFIEKSTDKPMEFSQKDFFVPEVPAPPKQVLGGLLKWPESDAAKEAREQRDKIARKVAHKKALAVTAEHKQAYDARVDGSFERARGQDLDCLGLINEWIPEMEQLSSSGLVEGETVVATIPVVGVIGGPREISGKIGPGALRLTKLPDKEVTYDKPILDQSGKPVAFEKAKHMVPQHRMHYSIQESTASFGYKEFAEYKKALVQKEDFGAPKSVWTHGLKKVAEKSEEHSAERTAVVQATRAEHMVVGAYSVMKVDDEFLHAHAEWQDTAKLSAYFEGMDETSSSSEMIRDLSKCSWCFCGKHQRWMFCCCEEACCFGVCHAGKGSLCKNVNCPKCDLPDCCKLNSRSGETIMEKRDTELASAGDSVTDKPKLEQFLVQYEKAFEQHETPSGLVMDRDAGLTPKGELVKTKFTRKLHTLHMLYRSPDSLWSTSDKLESVVLVIAPDAKMGDVVSFVSNLELLFPQQEKKYTRNDLSQSEVKRLAKGVEGPFSSIKVKMPTVTQMDSKSESTGIMSDNTTTEKKQGEFKKGPAKLVRKCCTAPCRFCGSCAIGCMNKTPCARVIHRLAKNKGGASVAPTSYPMDR